VGQVIDLVNGVGQWRFHAAAHLRLTKQALQGSIRRMTIAFKTADSISAHAWCMAAGLRDSLRTAQYYVRDMSNADGATSDVPRQATFLSRAVAGWARFIDRAMTKGGNLAIALLLPKWRQMPSPFAPGRMDELAKAINQNKLLENPLFNAYFFRSSQHILARWTKPPYLVLEHRIDAARRNLAGMEVASNKLDFLAHIVLALVEAAPIARHGTVKTGVKLLGIGDPNVAVCATACLALLLAEEGGEIKGIGEDEFFEIVGALMAPRLRAMQEAAMSRDVGRLAQELDAIRALY
jgi:hypothetical protein